jgi:hypothetical protein
MTPPRDELRDLWRSDPGGAAVSPLELLHQLEQRTHNFEGTISRRDLRETAAGVLVAAVFLWLAISTSDTLGRVAYLWLAVCGVWVIFYMRLYSKASRNPAPEQTLAAYQQALREKYDRQIRLLKSAKYWYVLPFWAGLLLSSAAYLERGGGRIGFWLMVVWATALNAAVWWLNESVGVRHLRLKQAELGAWTEDEGVSK